MTVEEMRAMRDSGLTYREIGEIAGVTVRWVWVQLNKGGRRTSPSRPREFEPTTAYRHLLSPEARKGLEELEAKQDAKRGKP